MVSPQGHLKTQSVNDRPWDNTIWPGAISARFQSHGNRPFDLKKNDLFDFSSIKVPITVRLKSAPNHARPSGIVHISAPHTSVCGGSPARSPQRRLMSLPHHRSPSTMVSDDVFGTSLYADPGIMWPRFRITSVTFTEGGSKTQSPKVTECK